MSDVARPDRVDETAIEQRRHVVAQLYLSHQTQAAIARQLGVDTKTVCNDLQALRQAWRDENRLAVSEMMERDLHELDEMEAFAARRLAEVNEDERKAVWFLARLKVKERRAKMLRFDAPDQQPGREETFKVYVIENGSDWTAGV